MKNRKLRVGLIGCGRFAVPGHAVYYTINPRCDFAAVCDVKEEQAKKVAGTFRVPGIYSDYLKMLDEADLDAVSICTPTFTHAEITAAAAERGIHVLCEKPFSTHPDEAEKMISVCRENGVVLHAGFNKRYDRGIGHVRKMILEETAGRCFHAELRWNGLSTFGTVPMVNNSLNILKKFGYSLSSFSPDWRLSDPRIPGGVLEVFCHILDLALWIFGEPEEVSGDAFKISPDAKKPEHAAILLKYSHGAVVFLNMSNKAISLTEKESGLFQCTGGNIRYETSSFQQTFMPASIKLETSAGFFGRRAAVMPHISPNPVENMPLYRRINNFLLDAAGELPADEQDTTPRGEAGLAVDRIIHGIVQKSAT